MTIQIRHYQQKDLTSLLAVWENASRLAHPFMSDAFFDTERHNIPNLYIPNADTWVAVFDKKVVGFIALIGNEVGGLFVEPKYHGKGFGKALMDKAKELHDTLEVDVFKENPIGRHFYERYGFKHLHEKTWDVTGDMIIRMAYTSD